MVVIAFGVLWLGYQELIFGYSLIKGYDITWLQLANPLSPYQWPAKGEQIPTVPKGQVLPSSSSSASSSSASSGSASSGGRRVIPGRNAE